MVWHSRAAVTVRRNTGPYGPRDWPFVYNTYVGGAHVTGKKKDSTDLREAEYTALGRGPVRIPRKERTATLLRFRNSLLRLLISRKGDTADTGPHSMAEARLSLQLLAFAHLRSA